MKKLLLSVMLFSFSMLSAQESDQTERTIQVTSNISMDYQPDFYKITVTIKEYENTDPIDQKVTRFSIEQVEESLQKKLKELNIKPNTLDIVNIYETRPVHNMYGYNSNYTATQKREIEKTVSFNIESIDQIENMFSTLRINGVTQVYASPMFTAESQLKIENELLSIATEKARKKADILSQQTNSKIVNILSIEEVTLSSSEQGIVGFNYNYYANNSPCSNAINKTITVEISYTIE